MEASGEAVSVTLAPGILDNIFDGIERPLERIAENAGAFITRGISVDSLDMEKLWDTKLVVNEGDILHGGDIYAQVQETRAIVHKCMVPPDLTGTVTFVASDGEHAIKDHMITLRLDDGTEKTVNNDPEMANQGSKTCSRQDSGMCATGNRPENTGYNVSDC